MSFILVFPKAATGRGYIRFIRSHQSHFQTSGRRASMRSNPVGEGAPRTIVK